MKQIDAVKEYAEQVSTYLKCHDPIISCCLMSYHVTSLPVVRTCDVHVMNM